MAIKYILNVRLNKGRTPLLQELRNAELLFRQVACRVLIAFLKLRHSLDFLELLRSVGSPRRYLHLAVYIVTF